MVRNGPLVFHPFLFAIAPVISLFSHNVEILLMNELYIPMVLVLVFTVALLFLLGLAIRDIERAGVIVSGFLILFFSFGHIVHATRHWRIGTFIAGEHIYVQVILWTGIFFLYAYLFARGSKPLKVATYILNIASIALIAIPLVKTGDFKLRAAIASYDLKNAKNAEIVSTPLQRTDSLPDIYFIILDRYADARTLKETYEFDNKEFISYLSGKGFYVAGESKSNYLKTAHSVASSLNLEYINHLAEGLGEDFADWSPLYEMLQDYKVWRFLKSKGYRFIHFGSWWGPTRSNRNADINVDSDPLPQLLYVLYRNTILYPLGSPFGILDFRLANWKRVHSQFTKLEEIPNIKEPTFVFAHFLITHEPYAFNRDGQFLTIEQYAKRSRRENYVEQVIFANTMIRALVDKLLSNSQKLPIIIIQSDEGPLPERFESDEFGFNWNQATIQELREKMGILNAYYLPNAREKVLYESITPVNSFRLVFNLYFNTNLELLPDRNYAFMDQRHPYKFFDVTNVVKDR